MGWRRAGLLVVAGWVLAVGVSFDAIANAADLDAIAPQLTLPIFLAAAALIATLVAFPTAKAAYMLGGSLAVLGIASRPAIVAINFGAGFTRSGWTVIAAVLVYGALALLGGHWWLCRVGPWVGRHQDGLTATGD